MRDGKYVVEYLTQDPLDQQQVIRIGEFEVEHDWIISVNGAELEEELKVGPLDKHTEDLIERQLNNGYYHVRPADEEGPEPRQPPTWSPM